MGVRIGVFDSGLGGLSVLKALRARLPQAELLYVADSAHAPYGERDEDFIAQRSQVLCRFLLDQGAQLIVVACNTATAAAIHHMRTLHPDVPIVGVEPGVKPAVARSPGGVIGVLATPRTLDSQKFKDLVARHGRLARIVTQPCPGLAAAIEHARLDDPALKSLVRRLAAPLRECKVDTVVLGCTHYPFVRHLFADEFGPDVDIIDTAEAVADQAARLSASLPAKGARTSQMQMWTSADPAHLDAVVAHWLNLQIWSKQMK